MWLQREAHESAKGLEYRRMAVDEPEKCNELASPPIDLPLVPSHRHGAFAAIPKHKSTPSPKIERTVLKVDTAKRTSRINWDDEKCRRQFQHHDEAEHQLHVTIHTRMFIV
jgi:hypothetical protein